MKHNPSEGVPYSKNLETVTEGHIRECMDIRLSKACI